MCQSTVYQVIEYDEPTCKSKIVCEFDSYIEAKRYAKALAIKCMVDMLRK